VTEPGKFLKAKEIYLNGVPGFPGPCPNEWLGSIDMIVYGTSRSIHNPDYGGGFLFKDMVRGKKIEIELESVENEYIKSTINLKNMGTARMVGTRLAFKNYTAFVNPATEPVTSIFHAIDMQGPMNELSFSGCGELNPIQNDPLLNTLKKGTKVLLNGSEGIVMGQGTRSSPEKPNLMISADLTEMDAHFMGGFKTGAGPEVYNTVATAIPITSTDILNRTFIRNEDISLPVADIRGRHSVLGETNYGSVWRNVDLRPLYDEDDCRRCQQCLVMDRCPTGAFQNNILNLKKCFGCGMCSYACPYKIFRMETGQVELEWEGEKKVLPITCRQSDLKRAKELAEELKARLINKEFFI
jgi:putative methanogenesis marker 16 metalloprotein